MIDIEATVARLVSENKADRERYDKIASRTVAAIKTGNTDELNAIVRQISGSEEVGESGVESVETGDSDRTIGN